MKYERRNRKRYEIRNRRDMKYERRNRKIYEMRNIRDTKGKTERDIK